MVLGGNVSFVPDNVSRGRLPELSGNLCATALRALTSENSPDSTVPYHALMHVEA